MAGRAERYVALFRRLRACECRVDMGADEHIEALKDNASRLADAVLSHCDDWAEGRAYAHAVRTALRKLREAQEPRGQTLEP